MNLQLGYQSPQTNVQIIASSGNLGLIDKTVRAGEYHAIGYDLQGMSQQQLETTKSQLEQAKTKLESKDQMQLASLTKHDLTGAILQANVQSYFAVNDAQDYLATANSGIVANRHLSFGTFQTYIQPNQRYGISLGGKMAGLQMDIDSMRRAAVSKDNSLDQLRGFILTQGPRQSANEHLVPESLFDDPNTTTKDVEGVSAVKALSKVHPDSVVAHRQLAQLQRTGRGWLCPSPNQPQHAVCPRSQSHQRH